MESEFRDDTCGDWPDTDSLSRVLVVNPLANWWSYMFTVETALRFREQGCEVAFLDSSPDDRTDLEVNRKDRRQRWRFGSPRVRLMKVLMANGIAYVRPDQQVAILEPPLFETLADLRAWSVDGRPSGQIVAAGVSGVIQTRDFDLRAESSRVVRYAREYLRSSREIGRAIDEYGPSLVATTNDRLLIAGTALSEARFREIATLVAYWGSTPHRYATYSHSLYDPEDWRRHIEKRFAATPPTPNALIEVHQTIAAAAAAGLPATSDFRRSMGTEPLPVIPAGRKVLAFFPTTPWEYSGLVARKEGKFPDQVAAIESILKILDPLEWVVVVRHHPPRASEPAKPEIGIWEPLRAYPAFMELAADSGIDSYQLMDRATLVAVWVSTIGVEAIARRLPLLVLGEPYWLDHTWGIHAATESDLTDWLTRPFPAVPADALVPFVYYFSGYGSPIRYFSGVGPEYLRLLRVRVFPRTALGMLASLALRLRRRWSA